MVWRTYNFPDGLWRKFETLRIRLNLKKQQLFELILEKGIRVLEEELEQKELEEKK